MSRLDRLREICREYGVSALYAFGSRGEEVEGYLRALEPAPRPEGSDCDIGVKIDGPAAMPVDRKVALAQRLEGLLGVERVDLVLLDEADPFLACNAIRGERLYAHDAHAADEYELYVLRRAGDLAPLERERLALLSGSA
jgi:uncharacterized protein